MQIEFTNTPANLAKYGLYYTEQVALDPRMAYKGWSVPSDEDSGTLQGYMTEAHGVWYLYCYSPGAPENSPYSSNVTGFNGIDAGFVLYNLMGGLDLLRFDVDWQCRYRIPLVDAHPRRLRQQRLCPCRHRILGARMDLLFHVLQWIWSGQFHRAVRLSDPGGDQRLPVASLRRSVTEAQSIENPLQT